MELKIPRLAISMQEGTLVEWLVADGDEVASGALIYLLEADKVENEIEDSS